MKKGKIMRSRPATVAGAPRQVLHVGGGHRKGKSAEVGRAVRGPERTPLQQESVDQGTGWGKSSES